MLLRVVTLTFLLLVTQMISVTCQDNTESIVETTTTSSTTIFNGSLLTDAKFTGKGITVPSRFTTDDSKDVNYEGTDKLKDFIQSARALDNFTTVTVPVTTTLKSGNNDYVEEVLGIKQTETNTDGIKQKQTSPDVDLNHLMTERTIFAKLDDKIKKESDYIYGDASFLDEGSGAVDISSTTIASNVVVTANSVIEKINSSPRTEENIVYDELDEYIYGGDIEEDTIFKETTINESINEDLANFNSTNNPLAEIPYSLTTQQVFDQHLSIKQETEVESPSAITDKIPQVKEVTPIEDYESSKSTDFSNLIIETQDLLTSDNTKTPLEIHTSTEENQFHSKDIKEYKEETSIFATTIPDPIISTENDTKTPNISLPSEVEESVITIPTTLEKKQVFVQNFTLDGIEHSSEVSSDIITVKDLTTMTEHRTGSFVTQPTTATYTSSASSENISEFPQTTTRVDHKTNLGDHTIDTIENEMHNVDSLTSKPFKEDGIVAVTGTEQSTVIINHITSSTFFPTTYTSGVSINPLEEETEQATAEDVATNHEGFYKQFGESTDNLPQISETDNWDDTINVTNYYSESTTPINSAEDSLETTTTIIDIWLAEENITRNNLNDPITIDITTSLIGTKDEDASDFPTVLTDDNGTTKIFIQDIVNSTTTESQDKVLTEVTTVPFDISTFSTETSTQTLSIYNTPPLNIDIKDGDDNLTQLEYDFEDIEEVSTKSSTSRKQKQMRDPGLSYISVETSTSTTLGIEATTSYVVEDTAADSQQDFTTATNTSDDETDTVQTAPEFNLYEDNLTSTIFSKELIDNGQFTAETINILKENNDEITENQLLNENDQLSTTTEINDNDEMSITENYNEEETIRNLEEELDNIREELIEGTTVKFNENISGDNEMRNEEDNIENNVEESTEDLDYNTTEAAIIEELLNNIEDLAADNKDNSVLVSSPSSKNISEKEAIINIIEKLILGQNLTERNISIPAENIRGNKDVMKPIVNQSEEMSEILEQATTTDISQENVTKTIDITEEEENVMQTVSEMKMEDITEEIEKEYNKKIKDNPETTEVYQANSSGLGYNTERITEESLFQKDAVITTDSVISSIQELEDLNSITSNHTSTLSSEISEDPTTKAVLSTNEEISTISKINIPFTSDYDEQETFSKHVFKTYIDRTTTEGVQIDLVEPISTQKSLLDLLRGENENEVEHTLTDRDTGVNLTALSEKNWNKITLNELSEVKQEEEEEEEEYKEDFEDGDINKIKLLGEELINGKNISLFSSSVSPNYFDEDYTEEYNSSEVYSGGEDDFTSYILILPGRNEDCIQGNISFRIFIGEHTVNIPENFHVIRNASEGLCNVIISWKSEDIANFNNTVMMSFEEEQDNYFIKFVEIIHIDNIEVTKSSKNGLMLLATKVGDVMEGSITIDFENGYQIELTNVNLRLCYNYQDEDLTTLSETQPVITNVMIIVICTATTSCLLFLVFAIILCRKLSTKATVYKMTIE